MSDGLPSEEQLRRMERTVMARIRRRAALPKRIATGAAVAAVFAGGVLLLPRLGVSGGGSSGSSAGGGSTAQYGESDRNSGARSGGGASTLLAVCHGSATADDPGRRVAVSASTPAAAVDACLAGLRKGLVPTPPADTGKTSEQRPLTAKDLVACRGADGLLQVFVADADPSTQCTRIGLKEP